MLLVCTRVLLICTRVLLVCTRMYLCVLVCYSYVTRMYSCGVLVTIVYVQLRDLVNGNNRVEMYFVFC